MGRFPATNEGWLGSRFSLLLLVVIFLGTLALRWEFLNLEPPSRLTFSDSPYTDEGWLAITSLNQVNDQHYSYSSVSYLTDRIHYVSPLTGAVNYLSLRYVGRGIQSRRLVAFTITSLLVLLTALIVFPAEPPWYRASFLVLSAGVFTFAYFYRLGNGYDIGMVLMTAIFVLTTQYSHSKTAMTISGLLLAVLVATLQIAVSFVACWVLYAVSHFARHRPEDKTAELTPWLYATVVFIAAVLGAWLVWLLPKGSMAEVVSARFPSGFAELVANLGDSHRIPVQMHIPFLLALFGVGLMAEGRRWRSIPPDRLFLILWVLTHLGWIACLSYRPLRYFQFAIFPMIILASMWIGDLVTRRGAFRSLCATSTQILGGVVAVAVLFFAFVPRRSSQTECVFVALGLEDVDAVLNMAVLVLPGLVGLLVVFSLLRRFQLKTSLLVITLVVGIVAMNFLQIFNWMRHDVPVTLKLQQEFAWYLDRPEATLAFNGPYLFNYLLDTHGVIYSYDEAFEADLIEREVSSLLVPRGSEIQLEGFAMRLRRAGARLRLKGRIESVPKVGDASVYGVIYSGAATKQE